MANVAVLSRGGAEGAPGYTIRRGDTKTKKKKIIVLEKYYNLKHVYFEVNK